MRLGLTGTRREKVVQGRRTNTSLVPADRDALRDGGETVAHEHVRPVDAVGTYNHQVAVGGHAVGISIGSGLGTVRAGHGLRRPLGGRGKGGGIAAWFAVALLVGLVYHALAWPWYLGSWVAVELGANNPSTARTVVAWIFEGFYLAVIFAFLAFLAWIQIEDRLETKRATERLTTDGVRAKAAQRAEEDHAEAQQQQDRATVSVQRCEAALAALNGAIVEYRTWARRMETHAGGVPAGRTGPEAPVPEGELVLGVLPDVWLTLPEVDGSGGPEVQTPVDCGDLVITDHAIRFEGPVRREEWRLDRIEKRVIEGHQATFVVRGGKTSSGVRANNTKATNVMLAVLDWADELPGPPVKALVRLAGASVTAQERLRDLAAQLTRDEAGRDRLRDDRVQGDRDHARGRPGRGAGVMTAADQEPSSDVYVTAKLQRAEALIIDALTGELRPGERLEGLFAVTKVNPLVSTLAVTSRRLLTFEHAALRKGRALTFVAEIPIRDVSSITVSGLLDNVVVDLVEAPRTKLGILDSQADKAHLLAAVRSAQSLTRGATSGQPATQPAATWPILEHQSNDLWPVYVAPDQSSATGSEPEPPAGAPDLRASRLVPTAAPASAKMAALEDLVARARNGGITTQEEAAARRRLFATSP